MAISDLTGTSWVFNEEPDISFDSDYTLTFTSNSTTYNSISTHYAGRGNYDLLYEGSYVATVDRNGNYTWDDVAFRTIEITGGTDATNSTLIAWLEANATQIGPEPPTPTTVQNLYFGSAKMVDSYWGASKIAQIYRGNTLVWEAGPPAPTVTVTNGTSVDNVILYDGQDNTGTLLGTLLMGDTDTYTITSGYIYAEWDDPYTTGDVTFSESGTIVGNPATISGNTTLSIEAIPLTNLTGTTWYFNEEITLQGAYLNYISNQTNYSRIKTGRQSGGYLSYATNSLGGTIVYYSDYGWESETYRTIEITGGDDATDSGTIAWLEANAIRIS